MKYAHFDIATRRIIGWYSHDVHNMIPEPNFQVSDEIWQKALENNFNHVSEDGVLSNVDFSTLEERIIYARMHRNELLSELDIIVSNPIRWNSFTDQKRNDLAMYRQNLLDVPQQAGFPDNIDWPVLPI